MEQSTLELDQDLTFHYGGRRDAADATIIFASSHARAALDGGASSSQELCSGDSPLQLSNNSVYLADSRRRETQKSEPESGSQTREYVDACVAMGVRIKMQVVHQLATLTAETPALICDHYALNAKDVVAIATAVNSAPVCTTLSLSNNSALQDDGVVGVCNVFIKDPNTSLTTLQMAKVGSGVLAARAMGHLIVSCNLLHLQLASNLIGDVGATALARALTPGEDDDASISCPALQYLDLTDTDIGSAGAAQLGHMLTRNGQLLHLDLSWNALRGPGAAALIGSIGNFRRLSSLCLGWTGLGSACATLGRVLAANSTLVHLDLSNCRLGPQVFVCVYILSLYSLSLSLPLANTHTHLHTGRTLLVSQSLAEHLSAIAGPRLESFVSCCCCAPQGAHQQGVVSGRPRMVAEQCVMGHIQLLQR